MSRSGSNGSPAASSLVARVSRWADEMGFDRSELPDARALEERFAAVIDPCRPGIERSAIDDWERRHGFELPEGLRVWLMISDGFYIKGPLIHPLSAIGPMVPFARMPELMVQPESWFELGNPNVETVCIDLGYRWPDDGHPIFTSGDDLSQSRPRIIATSFESWFIAVLRSGGLEYWFEPGFVDLGDPWRAHRRYTPAPPLPERLRGLAEQVQPLMQPGADERSIASSLGITLGDVEVLFRHLQHGSSGVAGS